ncbi:MAG: extracellular solute-binding protein [Chloroflexi bacterium]|nr:extracellular solute-binding protein [Chloroflexota bacterium]
MLQYRKDLLEAAGITDDMPPKNADDFKRILQAVTRPNQNQWGIASSGASSFALTPNSAYSAVFGARRAEAAVLSDRRLSRGDRAQKGQSGQDSRVARDSQLPRCAVRQCGRSAAHLRCQRPRLHAGRKGQSGSDEAS